ncbi:DMT family protein [Acidocella sp.]|uniref:DMT family protein n=1 Tax=Acidocella sp. TaxID=50710 RepID=UPI0026171DC9|nr:DMT family protein [Acidocella sp.]
MTEILSASPTVRALAPILLLACSNVFMTFAWYGQLKFPGTPLWLVIPISWGLAFFEYCLAVPANRIGYTVYSAAQLKTMQEVITLAVFAVFSTYYLGEAIKWNQIVAFGFLGLAAFFAFHEF